MANIGDGYGSECQLLRYLGRHREVLDTAVMRTTGAQSISWIDYPYEPSSPWKDGEWKGLDFLPEDSGARKAWPNFWPTSGNAQNWDAIGKISVGNREEWLLVEAKAHTGEIKSSCAASEQGGLLKIKTALGTVKADLGVSIDRDWLNEYYQFANRIAALWHMRQYDEPGRLLFIYFTGDSFPSGNVDCPGGPAGWASALAKQEQHLGVLEGHPFQNYVHKIFLPVAES